MVIGNAQGYQPLCVRTNAKLQSMHAEHGITHVDIPPLRARALLQLAQEGLMH